MFLSRFLIGNISSIALVAIIILLKKILKDKISLRNHYHIWFAFLLSLIVVLTPFNFIQFARLTSITQEVTAPTVNTDSPSDMPIDWRYDITEIMDSFDHTEVLAIIMIIWAVGALGVMAFYYIGHRKLRSIIRFSETPSNNIIAKFDECCRRVSVKGKVRLLQSSMITVPLTFGCRATYVVLPTSIVQEMSLKDIEHILLHEATHIKHKDILVNFLFCIEQIVYWFNPVVWWAFLQIRRDREAYCDWAVLNSYNSEKERLCYGDTLLRFAGKKNSTVIYTANGLFTNKAQIKYRIQNIASFKPETPRSKTLGHLLLICLSFIVFAQTCVLSAFASDFGLFYDPNEKISIVETDYSDLFNGISGCAVIFDSQTNHYTAYNTSMINKRVAPCSTCKIYSAINALQQGIITPKNNTLMWDRIDRNFPEWNSDQTLRTALRNSVNWYFQTLDLYVGIDELEKFYKETGYGNGYIGSNTDYYWNGSSLRISPLEQVELLIKLYNNEFSFEQANIDCVKEALFLSDKNGNRLYGKTGTGKTGNDDVMGWFVGYVETDNNTYFIAVCLQDQCNANGNNAVEIAYLILENFGIEAK